MADLPPYSDPDEVPDYSRMLRLDGRRFVVLGAGPGIGRQVAHALRAHGAQLVCVDRAPGRAEGVAKEVSGIGIKADAAKPDELTMAIDRAEEELGGLDGLVDVIGGNRPGPLLESTDDDWRVIFDISLVQANLAMRAGGAAIARAGGGTMAFVSSSLAYLSTPDNAVYSAAKAGLVALVRSAALELGPMGIRVNAVAPSMIATPGTFKVFGDIKANKMMSAAARHSATGRVNSTSDIAATLLFLSSPLSGNISGQTLRIDGGSRE